MNWVFLALVGAFFQAMQMAIKKKALQVRGMNSVIALVSYTLAGALLAGVYQIQNGSIFFQGGLSSQFWNGMLWSTALNILAVWFLYKALDLAELSHLMPYMVLTSLSLVIPPMILLGEFPSAKNIIGIVIIVLGALVMDWKPRKDLSPEEGERRRNNRKGLLYFLGTAACYTITPTTLKMAVVSSDPMFASWVSHSLIGIGFLPILIAQSKGVRSEVAKTKEQLLGAGSGFWWAVALSAVATALANGAINFALKDGSVSTVFAIKRVMPAFAFVIGVVYFKERSNLLRKSVATLVMVAGAIMVTLYK